MAIVTDGTAENASGSSESTIVGNADAPVQPGSATEQNDKDRSSIEVTADSKDPEFENKPDPVGHDRSEEVPSLLGGVTISENEEPETVTGQVSADEDTVPEDGVNVETPTIRIERENAEAEYPVTGGELKSILESLQDSVTNTQYISLKTDTISNDTASLVERVNGISLNCELLAAEIEAISSDATAKSVLSKTFLTISSLLLASLVIIQIYMFLSLNKIQRLQNSAGSSVLEHISNLNKKMADYDKSFAKALAKPVQQEHTQPNPAAAENSNLKVHENKEVSSAHAVPVPERLNKLRNGLPEKKLIRKETGDWFVYNKKSNECISDVEVIQALNEAYRKIGRTISTSIPLPPINALCLLKPDGKGGTEIVMTEKFLP